MSEKDPTVDSRVIKYHRAQRAKGFVQVKVWIPKGDAQKFKDAARKACQSLKELLD